MKRKGGEKWELVLPRIGIKFRWLRSRVLDGNIAVWARLRDEATDHLLDISLWTKSRGLISIWGLRNSGSQADISCWPLALWCLGVKIHAYRNQFQVGIYSLPGWMMLLKVGLILWCPDIFVEGRNSAKKTGMHQNQNSVFLTSETTLQGANHITPFRKGKSVSQPPWEGTC